MHAYRNISLKSKFCILAGVLVGLIFVQGPLPATSRSPPTLHPDPGNRGDRAGCGPLAEADQSVSAGGACPEPSVTRCSPSSPTTR
jgi:hypothetical protein